MISILLYTCVDTAISGESFDNKPPQLLSFSFHPIEVVTGDEENNILIYAHIIDSQSGLLNDSSSRRLSHANLSHAHFYSADWNENIFVKLSPTTDGNLASGDAYDGIYVAEIDVRDLRNGNWTLDHIYLVDNAGNSVTIDQSMFSRLEIPGSFVIDWDLQGREMARIITPPILFILLFLMIILRSTGFKSPHNGPFSYIQAISSHIKQIYMGEDGFASISKAQFFIWTFVAIFAYLMIISDRATMHSIFNPPSEVPYHLLLAMGLSVITASTAKAISIRDPSREINSGIDDKPGVGLFTDEKGKPDLSKIQMMAWTMIAISVFFVELLHNIWWDPRPPEIPDIDEALLALMGIGQGAYITKKLISAKGAKEESLDQVPGQVER